MPRPPNVLIFLTDAQQAATVAPGSPCLTPNFDRLAERGVRFLRAHTTNPTCSPARASLMTGLLPHNHGVLEVEHGRDADQCNLRPDKPHWARRLVEAGYRTGYFGKWHVERTNQLEPFGWQEQFVKGADHVSGLGRGRDRETEADLDPELYHYIEQPPGYNRILHYGVSDTPPEDRFPGLTLQQAQRFLADRLKGDEPWCCCVSFSEPNEALVVSREAWAMYDVDSLPLPANFDDDLSDRPAIYRRQREIFQGMSERQWREALACYYGRITELDRQFGRLIDQLEESGQLEETLVLMLSDHGRYVGAHGFDAHNFGAFEEIYNVPLLVAGPEIPAGTESNALVSIADIGPTLLDLAGASPIAVPDSRSFAEVLAAPSARPAAFETGYAEYHGTRFPLCQRILWQDDWKLAFNGFDYDELYQLAEDPHETRNRAGDPDCANRVNRMMAEIWRWVRQTGDRTILESHYYSMRFAPVGPNAAD